MSKQKTLKGSFSLCGKGLHTGLSLTVTFNPAPENTGYKIQRIDLEGEPVIQAVAETLLKHSAAPYSVKATSAFLPLSMVCQHSMPSASTTVSSR